MKSTREMLLIVHRWTGLTVGIVLMAVAITGLGMVFRPQLDPALNRSLHEVSSCAARLPLDQLADAARDQHAQGAVRQIELSHGGFGATIVRYADNLGVYLDPCTGRVLGAQDRWGGLFGTIEYLHRFRFLGDPDISETVAGSFSLTLALVMVAGGLVIWWPATKRQWKSAWKLRWQLKGAAFELNLHRTYGAYAAIVLLATTFASLTMVFDWARTAVFAATASKAPASKPHADRDAGPAASLEALLARTLATVPNANDITILLPKKKGDAAEVTVIERDAPHPNARTMVYLDPHTARLLRYEPYSATSTGYKVYRWLASLHMGYIGGFFGQVLLFAAVFAVPVLGYTGIRAWLRRRAVIARGFAKQAA